MTTQLSLGSVTLDGENELFAVGNAVGAIIYNDDFVKFGGKAKSNGIPVKFLHYHLHCSFYLQDEALTSGITSLENRWVD